jgi:hypothetical protein
VAAVRRFRQSRRVHSGSSDIIAQFAHALIICTPANLNFTKSISKRWRQFGQSSCDTSCILIAASKNADDRLKQWSLRKVTKSMVGRRRRLSQAPHQGTAPAGFNRGRPCVCRARGYETRRITNRRLERSFRRAERFRQGSLRPRRPRMRV